jgi:hypothetical protein
MTELPQPISKEKLGLPSMNEPLNLPEYRIRDQAQQAGENVDIRNLQ